MGKEKCKDCKGSIRVDVFRYKDIPVHICNKCYNTNYITLLAPDESEDGIEVVELEHE